MDQVESEEIGDTSRATIGDDRQCFSVVVCAVVPPGFTKGLGLGGFLLGVSVWPTLEADTDRGSFVKRTTARGFFSAAPPGFCVVGPRSGVMDNTDLETFSLASETDRALSMRRSLDESESR